MSNFCVFNAFARTDAMLLLHLLLNPANGMLPLEIKTKIWTIYLPELVRLHVTAPCALLKITRAAAARHPRPRSPPCPRLHTTAPCALLKKHPCVRLRCFSRLGTQKHHAARLGETAHDHAEARADAHAHTETPCCKPNKLFYIFRIVSRHVTAHHTYFSQYILFLHFVFHHLYI
jgi:hypothetical protein